MSVPARVRREAGGSPDSRSRVRTAVVLAWVAIGPASAFGLGLAVAAPVRRW